MPIGRGVRARKYKAHYTPAPTTGSLVAAMCNADLAQPLVTVTAASAANHNHHNHGHQLQHHHHRHQSSLVSDEEENTSEYSHPPSTSEHSTLESNPDMLARMHSHGGRKAQPIAAVLHGDRSTSTSSASESEAESEASATVVRSSLRSRSKQQRSKGNNNKRLQPNGGDGNSVNTNLGERVEPTVRV